MQGDPFAALELPHTATPEEIKGAYRRLVALYHPDNNPGFTALATAKVVELNEAYARAQAGWTPADGAVDGGPSGAADGARGRGPSFVSKRRGRSGGAPPWTPPAPVRHDNPPRRWDPPTPPPRATGPKPPPPRYPAPPPPRQGSGARHGGVGSEVGGGADGAARRVAFVADLVETGFLERPEDAERGHPVLEAFLPHVEEGDALRSCARHEWLEATGDVPPPVGHHRIHHAVPSAAVGGAEVRAEAIARLAPAQFIASTGETLLWTLSDYVPGDGILLQEDVAVHAVTRSEVVEVRRSRDLVEIGLQGGGHLTVRLTRPAAAALAAALTTPSSEPELGG